MMKRFTYLLAAVLVVMAGVATAASRGNFHAQASELMKAAKEAESIEDTAEYVEELRNLADQFETLYKTSKNTNHLVSAQRLWAKADAADSEAEGGDSEDAARYGATAVAEGPTSSESVPSESYYR